ncbi:acyltransferase [bacterium]|nr:MAG: acyltransferase [bacterium]
MGEARTSFGDLLETRKNNFDFLRVALATLVLVSHAKLSVATVADDVATAGPLAVKFLGGGRMALNWFFVISGFLIARSWLQSRSTWDYTKKRLLRIYPGFFVAMLVCVFVFGPLGGARMATYWTDPQTWSFFSPLIFGPLGTLPQVFEKPGVPYETNTPLWSIRFELFCYALVILFGYLGALKNRVFTLAAFVLATAVFTLHAYRIPSAWHISLPWFDQIDDLPRLISFFLSGTVFYLYREKIPYSDALGLLSAVGFVVAYKFFPTIGIPIFGTYLLFYIAFNRRLRLYDFGKRGDISYGLYLYGFPIQQLLVYHFGDTLRQISPAIAGRVVIVVLNLALTILVALASWHFVEKPFLKMKKKSPAREGETSAIADVEPTKPVVGGAQ